MSAPFLAATAAGPRTDWRAAGVATLAGIAAAMQVGKTAATLPLIRAEMGAGLTTLAVRGGLGNLNRGAEWMIRARSA